MADIIPFKGARYNPRKIKDLSKVVTPPYDVILPRERDEFYKTHPYNIVRLLLGKDLSGDNENDNKYIRAAGYIKDWQKKKILKKDPTPSIYINLQEFKLEGKIKTRIGFIALLKLEELDTEKSSIFPHEFTLSAPKTDRTKLLYAIEANLGPVFAIFEDKERVIDLLIKKQTKRKPLASIIDSRGVKNKFWRISDKKIIDKIRGYMKCKKIFIADGHHRYEVGLSFSKIRKDPKYGYILTYFTDLDSDGLVVLPYHRLIGGLGKGAGMRLENDLKKNFIVSPLKFKKDLKTFLSKSGSTEARFVIYTRKKITGLIFKDKFDLDVSIAKSLIIEPLGKIFIDFTKDLDYAIKEVDSGRFSFAILVNPVKLTEIRDVAFRGNRMPQKSTYFYPKVVTGLVINIF